MRSVYEVYLYRRWRIRHTSGHQTHAHAAAAVVAFQLASLSQLGSWVVVLMFAQQSGRTAASLTDTVIYLCTMFIMSSRNSGINVYAWYGEVCRQHTGDFMGVMCVKNMLPLGVR